LARATTSATSSGSSAFRYYRHGAQLIEHRLLRLAAGHAVNRMTCGNPARHELLSNRARSTSHKHLHQRLLDRGTIYTL
jgi:hypothetical protein